MSVTFFAADAQQATEGLEINMSNANAAFVLDALGFAEDVQAGDLCGELPAQDFLGRVLTAFGLAPVDEGVPAHRVEANFIECGRRPGYLQERLVQLQELAEVACGHKSVIAWG